MDSNDGDDYDDEDDEEDDEDDDNDDNVRPVIVNNHCRNDLFKAKGCNYLSNEQESRFFSEHI